MFLVLVCLRFFSARLPQLVLPNSNHSGSGGSRSRSAVAASLGG